MMSIVSFASIAVAALQDGAIVQFSTWTWLIVMLLLLSAMFLPIYLNAPGRRERQ